MLSESTTHHTSETPAATRTGLLIVLEGGEGAGKTTQWKRLTVALTAAGHDVVALREPGGTPAGDDIRRLLLDPASDLAPEAEALLFAASRAQLVHTLIRPALDRGAVVLVDRFLLSTLAYQGAGRGLSLEHLVQVNKLATGGLTPDATLLLTLPLSDAMARMVSRGGTDRIEEAGLAFHERVQRAFVDAADPAWLARHPEVGPVYLIEASGSPEMVTVRCLEQLAACFPTSFAGVLHG
ncbi:MAG: dTMP kinase [Gemmatimonadaceae bacterium]|nr:dTMP kinase [Gemmatimonadaceae bacterium]